MDSETTVKILLGTKSSLWERLPAQMYTCGIWHRIVFISMRLYSTKQQNKSQPVFSDCRKQSWQKPRVLWYLPVKLFKVNGKYRISILSVFSCIMNGSWCTVFPGNSGAEILFVVLDLISSSSRPNHLIFFLVIFGIHHITWSVSFPVLFTMFMKGMRSCVC